jgi:CDP-diacylglycerol--glycerol-3-phosphate 3-phosphatidyltransferase
LGIRPNALTYAAVAFGVGAAALFYIGCDWLAFAVLIVSGLLDAVDGRVGRIGGHVTAWGGVLDLTGDRIVEATVLLGIALPRREWLVPALVLVCSWYVNLCVFLAVGAASSKASAKLIAYPPGLLERSELLILVIVVLVAPSVAPVVIYLYAALVTITAAQRFHYGRRAL